MCVCPGPLSLVFWSPLIFSEQEAGAGTVFFGWELSVDKHPLLLSFFFIFFHNDFHRLPVRMDARKDSSHNHGVGIGMLLLNKHMPSTSQWHSTLVPTMSFRTSYDHRWISMMQTTSWSVEPSILPIKSSFPSFYLIFGILFLANRKSTSFLASDSSFSCILCLQHYYSHFHEFYYNCTDTNTNIQNNIFVFYFQWRLCVVQGPVLQFSTT